MSISRAAVNLIIAAEVGSPFNYDRNFRWPRAVRSAGVICGIDYACGYVTAEHVTAAWSDLLPTETVEHLADCAGLVGASAEERAAELRGVAAVPFDAAAEQYVRDDVVAAIRRVRDIPGTEALSPDARGALTSLVLSRSFITRDHHRYAEMKALEGFLAAGQHREAAREIEKMCRHWPMHSPNWNRRKHESALFEFGLVAPDSSSVWPPHLHAHSGTRPPAVPRQAAPPVTDALWERLKPYLA